MQTVRLFSLTAVLTGGTQEDLTLHAECPFEGKGHLFFADGCQIE